MKWKASLGLANVPEVGLLNPSNVPLILTLYQVACTSRPRRKLICGASSKPMLQFVDVSGARLIPPSRLVTRPVAALTNCRKVVCGPPDQLTPAGVLLHPKPVAKSLAASEPGAGGVLPAPHATLMLVCELVRVPGRLKSAAASLATTEYSPALAKRNEVPHPPLMVAPMSSNNCQVKPI